MGDKVTTTTTIGIMGGTGGNSSYSPHLHLAIYTGYVSGNPYGYSTDGKKTPFEVDADYYVRGVTFYDPMKVIHSKGQIIKDHQNGKI